MSTRKDNELERSSPPEILQRFFRWYCRPDLVTYIEGDLLELYHERRKESGKRTADLRFAIDVLLLFRPGIIGKKDNEYSTNYKIMLGHYFRIGRRNLARNKGYAIINVAGLALSMTCGILLFALVNHHLSFDKFHDNKDQTYRVVTELHRDEIAYRYNLPSPLGSHFRNDYTYADKVARIYNDREVLITLKKKEELQKYIEPEGITFAEQEFFEIFNFPLRQGDWKSALAQPNSAVITRKVASRYFGNENPIGEIFWLKNKIPFTVTGVLNDLPANTDFRSEIFVSYSTLKAYDSWMADDIAGWGGIRDGMQCFVQLKPGVAPAEVEEVLQTYVKKFRPTSKNVHHYKLQPLSDMHFNARYGGAMSMSNLWTMSIIGLFLLVTACLNFINLATAQALKRSKEVGVRKVLGSFKQQLFWQFIFETALIAAMGIVAAIGIASWAAPFVSSLLKIQIPLQVLTNPLMMLFCLALWVVITFLAGYYPAVILSGFQPVAALKGKLTQQSVGSFNTRRSLIVMQFIISQVLIIGMIVVINQMRFAKEADLGFEKNAVVMVNAGIDSIRTNRNAIKNEIAALPGVEKVSLCFAAPAAEDEWGNSIWFDNRSEEVNFRTSIKSADADYLSTFDLKLVAGRNLTPSDTVREILVNETMVRKLNLDSSEDALGRTIHANGRRMNGTIVGVLQDFHDKSFHEEISPVLITTYSEDYSYYAVRLSLKDAQTILGSIDEIWSEQHPDQLFEYSFLEDDIARFYESEEIVLKSIEVFSFIAIFIGCLGLHGLVSFMVAQKTKEVGIRKVLGGSVPHIVWIFVREFGQLIVLSSLVAMPAGWFIMSHWLQAFKFQIPITAGIFVIAFGALLFITGCTVSYQVVRSALANPVKSLRRE